jgi:hypothetical protein
MIENESLYDYSICRDSVCPWWIPQEIEIMLAYRLLIPGMANARFSQLAGTLSFNRIQICPDLVWLDSSSATEPLVSM